MTTKSLVTFERRFNDWMDVHPPSDFLGKDEDTFLSRQVSRIVESQLETADRIIVSQEDIADRIDKVAFGIERVSEGLESLRATFEWGFTEVIWRIEQTNELLKEILQVLQAPLDTQAKELKKRGEDAYRNGWFDDALNDFIESEKKNRYDFTIHHYLGNIYLFHKRNPAKALEFYKKAVKYATPRTPYYASFSLLHVGLIYYLQGNFQKAYDSTLKALELSSNLFEAHYQHAQYCANLGEYGEAIRHLRIAIVDGDSYYCIKADGEKDFDVMKKKLISLFEELRDKAYNQARNEINEVDKLIQAAKSYDVPVYHISEAKEKLDEMKTLLKRKSYFGSLKALRKAKDTQKLVLDITITSLNDEISVSDSNLKRLNEKSNPEILDGEGLFAWFVGVPVAVILTYFIGQLIGPFIPLWYLFWPVIIFIFFALWIIFLWGICSIPKFYYSSATKNEKEHMDTLKENLLDCQQLSEILDKAREKTYPKAIQYTYAEEHKQSSDNLFQ